MKKYVALALVLILCMAFTTACRSMNNNDTQPETQKSGSDIIPDIEDMIPDASDTIDPSNGANNNENDTNDTIPSASENQKVEPSDGNTRRRVLPRP